MCCPDRNSHLAGVRGLYMGFFGQSFTYSCSRHCGTRSGCQLQVLRFRLLHNVQKHVAGHCRPQLRQLAFLLKFGYGREVELIAYSYSCSRKNFYSHGLRHVKLSPKKWGSRLGPGAPRRRVPLSVSFSHRRVGTSILVPPSPPFTFRHVKRAYPPF
jgi:hypothetical protein